MAEADDTRIGLSRLQIELRKTRRLTHGNRQHARSEGVQCAEVPNLANAQNAAHLRHNVMRGEARRFVNDEDSGDFDSGFRHGEIVVRCVILSEAKDLCSCS